MQILLGIQIVVMGAMTLTLISVLYLFGKQASRNQSVAGVQLRKGDIESMLYRGENKAARLAALKWRKEEPGNAHAYMLLLKAQFRLDEYIEAKRTIEELVRLAPEYEFTTKNYLSRINDAISHNRPHAVE